MPAPYLSEEWYREMKFLVTQEIQSDRDEKHRLALMAELVEKELDTENL